MGVQSSKHTRSRRTPSTEYILSSKTPPTTFSKSECFSHKFDPLEEKRIFDEVFNEIWNSLGTPKASAYTYEVLLEVKLKGNIIPDCSGWFLPSQAGQLKVSDEMTVHQPVGHITSRNGQAEIWKASWPILPKYSSDGHFNEICADSTTIKDSSPTELHPFSSIGIISYTISRDNTMGEDARRSKLLAEFGKRTQGRGF